MKDESDRNSSVILYEFLVTAENNDNESNIGSQPIEAPFQNVVTEWKSYADITARLPSTFQFPSMRLLVVIQTWYCGDVKKSMQPY